MGRCPDCQSWNSLVEETISPSITKSEGSLSRREAIPLRNISIDGIPRYGTKSQEFNRVLGGGIVIDSVLLVGGDPGIGKSTLLLQEAAGIAKPDHKVLYVTGEESLQQTKMRAQRLRIDSDSVFVLAETELEAILDTIEQLTPKLVIVDSIQTISAAVLTSAPGSISQVRECALKFIHIAKTKGIPVLLVGHVTKEGYLAGPKVLEHMVDALFLFEGDRDHFYRILRSIKNRFGSTREIGVFEMSEKGMLDVPNPSAVFLSERQTKVSGSAVICTMEGTRPILVEIQALVTPSNYGLPQRTTTGFDNKRLTMLLAVLEKRLGYRIGTMDVFVNVVGGMRIDEPAADLGMIACIASSIKGQPIESTMLTLGEVGLGGELRSVSHVESRLLEANKMGFTHAVVPVGNRKNLSQKIKLQVMAVDSVAQALDTLMI